jgi:hypothetical protein
MLLVCWWLPLKVGIELKTGDISRCGDGNGVMASLLFLIISNVYGFPYRV